MLLAGIQRLFTRFAVHTHRLLDWNWQRIDFSIIVQIIPIRIVFLDQANFPLSIPMFKRFFPNYRRIDLLMDFILDELRYTVVFSKTRKEFIAMLINSFRKIVRHTDV